MSAGVSHHSGKGQAQDFELNLASIIDCFTVLITYLLVSTSFLSLSMLDVGVVTTGAGAEQTAPASVSLTVLVDTAHNIHLTVGGTEKASRKIAARNGSWDLDGLNKELRQWKEKHETLRELTVTADGPVKYKDIVQVIDSSRKILPEVYLGDKQVE